MYNDLTQIAERYKAGRNIDSDIQWFHSNFNLAGLTTYKKITLKLEPSKQDSGVPTGAAAEVYSSRYLENNNSISTGVSNEFSIPLESAGGNFVTWENNIQVPAGSYVNPNYILKGGYHRNCQVCIVVFEARIRGYNIQALPFDENNKIMLLLRQNPNNAFIDRKTNKPPKLINTHTRKLESLHKYLNNIIKSEERYGLIFKIETFKNSGILIDHIITVYKNKFGELKFYDPQNGVNLSEEQLSRIIVFGSYTKPNAPIKYHNPKIFRIDNADLRTDYLNEISKKSDISFFSY